MKNNITLPVPELSRPLKVDRIPLGGVEEKIVASPLERQGLAERFGLIELPRFEAFLNVDRAEGAMIAVTGTILAEVVQQCVVTLEPVPSQVRDTINVLYAPPHLIKNDREGPLGDIGEAEAPEPIENGVIDLGELASQHLATALDPYPRKEGAELGRVEANGPSATAEITPMNPFALLKQSDRS
ncbi:MAG: DUF177 domain-containing protein [Bdellovibrionales bacterium]